MSAKRIKFSRELTSTDVHENLRDAILAEKQGYDFVWIPDHLTDIPPPTAVLDAWTALSYVGSHTKKDQGRLGVTDTPEDTSRQDREHRRDAGQHHERARGSRDRRRRGDEHQALRDSRGNRARYGSSGWREAIRVIRLLWASTYSKPVSFKGEHYSLDQAHLDLPPVQKPSPPIYVGAYSSSKMLAIAGELADGWYPAFYYTVDSYREKLGIIREAARKAGQKLRFHRQDGVRAHHNWRENGRL